VASKGDRLVVLFAAPDAAAVDQAVSAMRRALGSRPSGVEPSWQLAVSRPRSAAEGVHVSYHEAGETLSVAQALGLGEPVVHARDVVVPLLLLRDRAGLRDLVDTVLSGLSRARGGPTPLVQTL